MTVRKKMYKMIEWIRKRIETNDTKVEESSEEEQNRWDTINKGEKKDKQQREEKDKIVEREEKDKIKERRKG